MKLNPTIILKAPISQREKMRKMNRTLSERIHIDFFLFFALLSLTALGLFVLYSASNGNSLLVFRQIARLGIAYFIMIIIAQIPPTKMRLWIPWIYLIGVLLLTAVLIIGDVGKGAQRWLDLGFIRFQPSEIMKLAIPMFVAWYLADRELPPSFIDLLVCAFIIAVPVLMTAKQPDLGTALMLAGTGAWVLFLAGMRWRLILLLLLAAAAAMPALWFMMHGYQRQRVLTFLNPESDPLGAGYHLIQSKIAIGSGGVFGKGWLNGTQSHLNFLPEHATDFIFAVLGEELGLVGGLVLLAIVTIIMLRGLYMSTQAQDTFTRLVSGSLILTFFLSIFINIGMVTGLLPVVGVPLPLFSYGGTSMVTLMASFGVLMSIHTHRRLVAK